ncbi:MAG: hypothetical protein ABI861_13730 [Panacibacter sp.]
MLERVPADKFAWNPHEKSMSLPALATHIAERPKWIDTIINHDEIDFAKVGYTAPWFTDTLSIVQAFDGNMAVCIGRAKMRHDYSIMLRVFGQFCAVWFSLSIK